MRYTDSGGISITVTFCGHGSGAIEGDVVHWLEMTVEDLIDQGATKFFHGGYGAFDRAVASVVWNAKKRHPNIVSVLVLPYLDAKLEVDSYDYTTYPPIEKVPRRYAISARNRWMVSEADVVVAYVLYSWGGAAKTLDYAVTKKKRIISYAECQGG